jgi:hypothetical protein
MNRQTGPDMRMGYPYSEPPTEPIRIPRGFAGFLKRKAPRFIEHPLWTSLGAIIGVVGIVVSIYQLAGGPGYTPAALEVAIVSMSTPAEIEATVTSPGSDQQRMTVIAAPVDITLKNNGDKPALITAIEAELLYYKPLDDCASPGAGPGVISAYYSIKLPTPGYDETTNPGPYLTSTRFEVKPASVDRMQLTIGPEEQLWATNYAKVMAVRLTLVHDGSEKLEVGTVEIATTGENVQNQIEHSKIRSCAKDNMAVLDELYAIQGYHAPDLDKLRAAYQRLAL